MPNSTTEPVREVFGTIGHHFRKKNIEDSFEVPASATLFVDSKGMIRNVLIESGLSDHSKGIEPNELLQWADCLSQTDK